MLCLFVYIVKYEKFNYRISGRIVSISGIRPDIKDGRISGRISGDTGYPAQPYFICITKLAPVSLDLSHMSHILMCILKYPFYFKNLFTYITWISIQHNFIEKQFFFDENSTI